MKNKFTLAIAQAIFLENGCTLLAKSYTDMNTPMPYRCQCEGESVIRLSNFLKGQRCKSCLQERKSTPSNRFTYEDIANYVNSQGCVLLTKTEGYQNTQSYIDFTCGCGGIGSTSFSNFKRGRRCMNCRDTRGASARRRPMSDVSAMFSEHGYTVIDTEYKNTRTPIAFRCPRGHEHTIMLSNWKRGYRCRKCYEEDNVGPNHPNWVVDRDEKARLDSLRNRYYSMLHSVINSAGLKKQGKAEKLLGYDWKTLYAHLRAFPEWCTLQKGCWHIDHIFPIDCFIKAGITDPAIINALDNLRPITGKENCSKGNRYNHREFERYLKRKNISPPKSVQETL